MQRELTEGQKWQKGQACVVLHTKCQLCLPYRPAETPQLQSLLPDMDVQYQ